MHNNYDKLKVHKILETTNNTNNRTKKEEKETQNTQNTQNSGFLDVLLETMKNSTNSEFRKSLKINEKVKLVNSKKEKEEELKEQEKKSGGFDISV